MEISPREGPSSTAGALPFRKKVRLKHDSAINLAPTLILCCVTQVITKRFVGGGILFV